MDRSTRQQRPASFDGIGCVGLLLLGTLVLSLLGMLANRPAEQAAGRGSAAEALAREGAIGEEANAVAVFGQNDPGSLLSLTTLTSTPSPTSAPSVTIVTATKMATALPSVTLLPASATATQVVATVTTTSGIDGAGMGVTRASIKPSASPTGTATPTWTPTATPPPLPTPYATFSVTVKVPILMYHYISEPPEDADEYREDLSVTPGNFRAQMQYLAENGFTPIDLYDLSLAVTAKQGLPPRPVVITFDDGYLDHYQNAFPILQEFGFSATFFIITEYVDHGSPAYVSWPMIEEMAAAGMRIESHSRSHPDLYEAEHDELIWQLLGSQETLAAHIGYTPRYFCYPGGRYDENTIAMLEELDYWGAVTTAGGKWHGFKDRFEWSRLRMRNTTTLPEFADMVAPDE